MKHIEILEHLEACKEAVEWAMDYESLEHAWSECKRSDWMLWLDRKLDLSTDKDRRMMACWFVRRTPIGDGRTVWDLLDDERSCNAVIVAEKYANGEATQEELSAARDAAWDAASDAARDAAWDAASDAASDAARYAARAVGATAWAAALATACAAALATAWDASATVRAVQCDIIRSYGNPFNENNKKGE